MKVQHIACHASALHMYVNLTCFMLLIEYNLQHHWKCWVISMWFDVSKLGRFCAGDETSIMFGTDNIMPKTDQTHTSTVTALFNPPQFTQSERTQSCDNPHTLRRKHSNLHVMFHTQLWDLLLNHMKFYSISITCRP